MKSEPQPVRLAVGQAFAPVDGRDSAPPPLERTFFHVGTALLRSVTSTSSVLRSICDQLSQLEISSAVFLLTEKTADALVVAALGTPGTKSVVSHSRDAQGYHPLGYTVPLARVPAILQTVADEQPRYLGETRSLILELAPTDQPEMTQQLIRTLGGRAALLCTIPGIERPLGVLVLAREGLLPGDLPVARALAEKLSEAIQTARLFEELRRAHHQVKERESHFRTLFETQPDAIMLVDRESRVVALNRAFVGVNPERALTRPLSTVLPSDLYHQLEPLLEAVQREGKPSGQVVRHQERTGASVWIDARLIPVFDNRGNLSGIFIQHRDITQRRLVEVALAESEKRYRQLLENALVGVYQTTVDGKFLYANGEMARIFEFDGPQELLQAEALSVYKDPEQRAELLARLLEGTRVDNMELEVITRTGAVRTVLFAGTMHGNVITGMLLDITERKAMQERLWYDAVHDKLTGLPNRSEFLNRVDQALWQNKRYASYLFAVLLFDVDEFKLINDSLGHTVGDRLLLDIARRLEGCLGEGDSLARIGGDEFGVLLHDLGDANHTFVQAAAVQRELSRAFEVDGHEIYVTASIGIALPRDDSDSPEDLLRNADTALYRAKAMGRGHHEVFDIKMHHHTVERLQIETDLRRALDRSEFSVQYQPIVSLVDGRLAGFEALLRWKHPDKGLLNPVEFVPIAEDCGLVIPVDRWVFEAACEQLNDWQSRFSGRSGLYVSVNFSGRQFSQPDVIEMIRRVIEELHVDPRQLRIEITESVLMANPDNATSILSLLKLMEIQVDLDDFGTGYSSLSYLHRFPINRLKIDRSFVGRLAASEKDLAFVRTIIGLAHLLDLRVVAEGIEDQVQVDELRRLTCEFGQGYLFSPPIDADEAARLIESDHCWSLDPS
ncbi:MAG: EAL domain-containing protein [Myxococcales bacterium]|nr:EAL domain-containing protein [Myxococcales bacterium]